MALPAGAGAALAPTVQLPMNLNLLAGQGTAIGSTGPQEISVLARGDDSGQSVQGTMRVTNVLSGSAFSGPVQCLAVDGDRAVAGASRPGLVGGTVAVVVRDTGLPIVSPPDQAVGLVAPLVQPTQDTCRSLLSSPTPPVVAGDFTVLDG